MEKKYQELLTTAPLLTSAVYGSMTNRVFQTIQVRLSLYHSVAEIQTLKEHFTS